MLSVFLNYSVFCVRLADVTAAFGRDYAHYATPHAPSMGDGKPGDVERIEYRLGSGPVTFAGFSFFGRECLHGAGLSDRQ